MKWQPIETAPKATKVLITYNNSKGKSRVIVARYLPKYFMEDDAYFDDSMDYNEENDTYYYPEGWYEQIDNWDSYTDMFISEGVPTHWMPLPNPPQGE